MEKKHKKPNIIFSFIELILLVFSMIILISIVTSRLTDKTPKIFGVSFHIVVTASMEPDIMVGDFILVKEADISDIKIGDDVLFDYKGIDVIHRVVGIKDGKLITHGINNPDDVFETTSSIHGKCIFVSTFIGFVIIFLQQNILLIISLIFVIIAVYQLLKILKNK